MNDNIKEYLKVLEEECGENKCQEAMHVDERRMDIVVNPSYSKISKICKYRLDYKWKLKDRLRTLWINFLLHSEYLSKYNPFDFRSYQTEWNPYGFDIYAKISQTSTPWKRFKGFCLELKALYYSCRDAFFHTPFHIQHYQGNKKRIGWFEKNIWSWFSGSKKEKEKFEKNLKSFGYTISEDKSYIYYDQKIQNERK